MRSRLCDLLAGLFEEKPADPQNAGSVVSDLDVREQDLQKSFTAKRLTALEMLREKIGLFPKAAEALRKYAKNSFTQAFSTYAGYYMLTLSESDLIWAHREGEKTQWEPINPSLFRPNPFKKD
jgi:hypothetical protein